MIFVRCKENDGAPRMLTVGRAYRVAVVVNQGTDYKDRPSEGYVLADVYEGGIPRVWDKRRFDVITEEEYNLAVFGPTEEELEPEAEDAVVTETEVHDEIDGNEGA